VQQEALALKKQEASRAEVAEQGALALKGRRPLAELQKQGLTEETGEAGGAR
jgi:hypothetical protein